MNIREKKYSCHNDFNTSLADSEDNNICSIRETENIRVEKTNFSLRVFAEKSQEGKKTKENITDYKMEVDKINICKEELNISVELESTENSTSDTIVNIDYIIRYLGRIF
ncbi:hypothetical protein H311_00332 [Anncaliia algerae PRA109]|nr:hypothetical protein H311_00332 [Anncaliia algerae PRA109]